MCQSINFRTLVIHVSAYLAVCAMAIPYLEYLGSTRQPAEWIPRPPAAPRPAPGQVAAGHPCVDRQVPTIPVGLLPSTTIPVALDLQHDHPGGPVHRSGAPGARPSVPAGKRSHVRGTTNQYVISSVPNQAQARPPGQRLATPGRSGGPLGRFWPKPPGAWLFGPSQEARGAILPRPAPPRPLPKIIFTSGKALFPKCQCFPLHFLNENNFYLKTVSIYSIIVS